MLVVLALTLCSALRTPHVTVRKATADDEEAEIMRDAAKIAKKKRSNMFNENGVAYAPWMLRQVDEEATNVARALRAEKKRKERKALEDSQGVVNIVDSTTSELTGQGLKAKVGEGEVELSWYTDAEDDNLGFIVEKKRVGVSEWKEIGDYKGWSPLKSKGVFGGSYTYVDPEADEGEYLYRVIAEQFDKTRAVTCQVGVTVESASQQLQTKIIVAISGLIFASFFIIGATLDPLQG